MSSCVCVFFFISPSLFLWLSIYSFLNNGLCINISDSIHLKTCDQKASSLASFTKLSSAMSTLPTLAKAMSSCWLIYLLTPLPNMPTYLLTLSAINTPSPTTSTYKPTQLQNIVNTYTRKTKYSRRWGSTVGLYILNEHWESPSGPRLYSSVSLQRRGVSLRWFVWEVHR